MSNWQFGNILKTIRQQMQIGVRDAAKRIGWDCGNYCKIESGKISPPNSIKKVKKITRGLGIGSAWESFLITAALKYHVDKVYSNFEDSKQPNRKGDE